MVKPDGAGKPALKNFKGVIQMMPGFERDIPDYKDEEQEEEQEELSLEELMETVPF